MLRDSLRSFRLPPRMERLSQQDIKITRHLLHSTLRVYFADGRYSLFSIDTMTTCAELEMMVVKRLGVKDPRPFAIMETAEFGDEEDRFLNKHDRISEIIALWTRSYYQSGSFKDSYRLVFKVQYFFDIDFKDMAAVELWYVQSVRDILNMRYLCTDQDCYVLAALQLQEELGDYRYQEFVHNSFCNSVENYIPSHWLPHADEKDKLEAVTKKVLHMYEALAGYSQLEARLSYLEFVCRFPVYGCQFFMVKVRFLAQDYTTNSVVLRVQ